MKLSKTISALFLSLVLIIGSLGQANAAKDYTQLLRTGQVELSLVK